MNMRIIAGILLGLSTAISGFSQGTVMEKPGNLDLRLQPDNVKHGVPQGFTFLLVNTSGHDLRVPMPAIECDDSYFGAVQLHLKFVPLKLGYAGVGNACSLGYGGMQDILDRANGWKVLHAGESLSLKAKKKKLYYTTNQAGSYEFWSEYTPAELSAADQEKLRVAGIDYPHEKLTSTHVSFQKKP